MNVILIPFFLAANVVVNNTSEWAYGPEYLYNVNCSIKWEPEKYDTTLISTMKCRPKVAENSLLCILTFTTTVSMKKDKTPCDHMFEIKFNEQGVESVLIGPQSCFKTVDFILMIVNQLRVDFDMKRKICMLHFTETSRENTSMGNCTTMHRITREESPETLETHNVTEGADFQLVVLPIADARPGTTLTIEKFGMDCTNSSPSHRNFPLGIWKMKRFSRKIYVDGMRGFETYTEMDMELPMEYLSFRISFLTQLSLDSIVPAQNPLPFISNGELIDII